MPMRHKLMEATPGMEGSTSSPATPGTSATSSNTESSGGDFDFAALAMDAGGGDDAAAPATTVTPVAPAAGSPSPTSTPPTGTVATPAAATPPGQPPAPQGTAPAPGTPAPAAAVPPAAPAAPGSTPGQPPAQTPQAAQPPTGTQPQQLTPEAVAQSFAQHRDKFIPQLQTLYAIPETEVEELRTNPETALPKLAAKLHYEVQLGVFNSLIQTMPEMIGHIVSQRAATDKLETQFKDMYPALHDKAHPEYEKVAENSIRAVRQVNPQMPMTEVLQKAGILALMTLNLPIPGQAPANPAAPAAPAVPAQRMPTPGRPAGTGGAVPAPMGNPGSGDEGNIFAQMADDMLAGD